MNDILTRVAQWHKDAKPITKDDDLRIALAVHIEEFLEMLNEIEFVPDDSDPLTNPAAAAEYNLTLLMQRLKERKTSPVVLSFRRKPLLDSLADQIVTATGVGVVMGMDVVAAVDRVATSNDTKRCPETGAFTFNEQGKITKPSHYVPPDLSGLY
jgi:predicted HAD superfamily Cof-like phosphohydrolase